MDKFWNTDRGKILSYGIHEHNSGLGHISNSVSYIKNQIEQGTIKIVPNNENKRIAENDLKNFNNCLDRILKGREKCKDSMDYVYEEVKKIEKIDNEV